MDYNGNIFGINDVNSFQIKNVQQSNYRNWPELATVGYGYISGGDLSPSTAYCSLYRIDHTTEVISSPGTNLSYGVARHAGLNSSSYGYFCSGNPYPSIIGQSRSTISRIDFNTEVISLPGKNISNSREGINFATLSSVDYGYILGGSLATKGSGSSSYVTRLDFSTETVRENNQYLYAEIEKIIGVSGKNSGYGYLSGGQIAPTTYNRAITRLDFNTEIITNRLPQLAQAKINMMSCESQDYGYFAGGTQYPNFYSCTIDRLSFSDETVSTLANYLLNAANSQGGTSTESLYYGYMFPSGQNTISRINFSNDTTSLLGRVYPYITDGRTGVSSQLVKNITLGAITGTYGYSFGGQAPSRSGSYVSDVTRMDFATEVTSFNRCFSLIDISEASAQGASTSSYGYFGGGRGPGPTAFYNTISRIDFSNQVVSQNATNMPSSYGYSRMLGLNNNTYAYFIAGTSPFIPSSCTVFRMNFSDETVSTRTNFPVGGLIPGSSISGNPYGYILNPCTIYRYDFSSETSSLPGKNIPTTRSNIPTIKSSTYAYFAGGSGPVYFSTITRLEFSTETVNDPGKFIPTAIANATTFQNSTTGYISSGENTPAAGSVRSSIQKIEFSTETASNVPSPALFERAYSSGVSDTTS